MYRATLSFRALYFGFVNVPACWSEMPNVRLPWAVAAKVRPVKTTRHSKARRRMWAGSLGWRTRSIEVRRGGAIRTPGVRGEHPSERRVAVSRFLLVLRRLSVAAAAHPGRDLTRTPPHHPHRPDHARA